ncbi:MAG: glycosyltransferase [Salinivirgaceae bacterium]|nr:glycosyltransferase [Salinivirgaceae bacterium]
MIPNQILYISYDGMTDSLGRSQVLPYLCALTEKGWRITLISAEKPEVFAQGESEVRGIVDAAGIDWQPMSYTKRPPIISTLLDILTIKRMAFKLTRQKDFGIVHCRSYIAAFVGLALKNKFGCRFVFDMRGFYADERVDGNIWNTKKLIYRLVYNFFKRKEKDFMSGCDAIVSLTNAAKSEILQWNLPNVTAEKITVIPCCADVNHFDYRTHNQQDIELWRQKLGIDKNAFVLSYLGSVGTWYMLPEMMDFFAELLAVRPDAVFLLITRDNKQLILEEAARHGIGVDHIIVQPATRNEVPQLAMLSSASLFFIKPVWSKKASSPTKLAELMALGIACVTNKGVGDVDGIIENNPLGVLVNGWTRNDYAEAIRKMLELPADREASRRLACEMFSLDKGAAAYDSIYKTITH